MTGFATTEQALLRLSRSGGKLRAFWLSEEQDSAPFAHTRGTVHTNAFPKNGLGQEKQLVVHHNRAKALTRETALATVTQ